DLLDIEYVALRIADCLSEDGLRLRRDRLAEVVRITRIHHVHLNAKLRQSNGEQIVCTAVQAVRGHDLITCTGDIQDRISNRSLSTGQCQRRNTALKRGHTLLEYILRWIHNPCVDVTALRQS